MQVASSANTLWRKTESSRKEMVCIMERKEQMLLIQKKVLLIHAHLLCQEIINYLVLIYI